MFTSIIFYVDMYIIYIEFIQYFRDILKRTLIELKKDIIMRTIPW